MLLITQYAETGSFVAHQRSGRPRLLDNAHYVAIDNSIDSNNEITTRQLKDELFSGFPDLKVSERTIAQARQELGWVHQNARYRQLVREVNKGVRLEWE